MEKKEKGFGLKENITLINTIKRRVRKMKTNILITLLCCILVICAIIWVMSPGTTRKFYNKYGHAIPQSISEKCFIEVNGTTQGMIISSIDSTKPVLLVIHGGPGMPEYAISREYPLVLEQLFTVCWWDHRGAGLSYNDEIPIETMTFEQFVDDAIEMTNYLRKRFNKEKIYLLAHSGGTMTGIMTAAKAPELFHAYIAMSQISNQIESEKLAYKYMLNEFEKAGDSAMLKKFRKYPINKLNTPSYYAMRDFPMHKLGIGTTRRMKSVVTGVFLPVMLCKELTLKEKINVWKGKAFNTKTAGLWDQLVRTDLTQKVTELKIPVYFFNGIYDYTVSYQLAKQYYEMLEAPVKGFYSFQNSAHSPLFEEPERMKYILEYDVLKNRNYLGDLTTL